MNGRLLLLLLSCVLTLALVCGESRPAWGDWVVAGDDADTGASILLRRITPKSVFVAPTFTGCSEGYRQDSLGRCVKLVKVNQQSQWNFFLERLNSMYAPSSTSKKPQETGPFHINLPLANNPQESVVQKRLPPPMQEVKTPQPTQQPTTTTRTTTTARATTIPPQTSTWPTTTMSESTTPEVSSTTVVEPTEVTTTEKDLYTDPTLESRRETTTDGDVAVMLGDQPFQEAVEESFGTPKSREKIQVKPFLIIVTNPTVTREDTTPILPEENETSTTEATTEGNTKFTTEIPETFGESRDATESSIRPTVTFRPGCEDSAAFENCEPVGTEVVLGESSPSSLPELPLLDPSSQVRFPSESFVPVRKTQSYVRFPDVANPHEDRPAFWWPSWEIRRYPGIHGWPESSEQIRSTDRVIQRKYPMGTTWSSMAWQRRFLQRD
ncbi:mucin-2-like [Macrosteles quadrilineatus]|uniref:mucin-2-like n=1 Tax=Macrosteles quadrilineatus TaxID=74068 RepID=UPI0023E34359|nr:mucin-2-like [Macrosteles quadrilineatus]XP_054284488.1 mucin-2-like [Macrosteles quadrilineatus]